MTNTPKIILNHLSFYIENTQINFEDISLTFEAKKYGIVGKNGVGKTTLLRLISGELKPDTGNVQHSGNIVTAEQSHHSVRAQATLSEALGVDGILQALNRVENGELNDADFDIIGECWDIKKQVADALSTLNLWPIDLKRHFHKLSGGQKTKVLLAKTLISTADFLIFDEPTNNLDKTSREILYQYIDNAPQGIVIVSHDRTLLNQCDQILELTSHGIQIYGGNYDFYREQKTLKETATLQAVKTETGKLKKTQQVAQTRLEKHAQGDAKGRLKKKQQISAKGQYNKIEMKAKKNKSEKSNRCIRQQADRKLDDINNKLITTRNQLESNKPFSVALTNTAVSTNKKVLDIDALSFHYPRQTQLIDNFNLELVGPERVAITGANGSGKSTLVKLIRGILQTQRGRIMLGVQSMVYLDQTVSLLKPELSLVDNYLILNPTAKSFDAYAALASFKFRNKDAEKIANTLSGGEKMRAGLAISLMSIEPPQLIILDEPTNHLDIEAIEAIEVALTLYQGAMLVVSHDEQFLKNINISRYVSL